MLNKAAVLLNVFTFSTIFVLCLLTIQFQQEPVGFSIEQEGDLPPDPGLRA